jgi:hypothetical protein
MKLNQANIKTIDIRGEKLNRSFPEHIVFDEEMPGFGVRVLPGQGKERHRSYIVQGKIGAKHHRQTLGTVAKITLEDARK